MAPKQWVKCLAFCLEYFWRQTWKSYETSIPQSTWSKQPLLSPVDWPFSCQNSCSAFLWIGHPLSERYFTMSLIIFWQNTLPANIRKWVFNEIKRDGRTSFHGIHVIFVFGQLNCFVKLLCFGVFSIFSCVFAKWCCPWVAQWSSKLNLERAS